MIRKFNRVLRARNRTFPNRSFNRRKLDASTDTKQSKLIRKVILAY